MTLPLQTIGQRTSSDGSEKRQIVNLNPSKLRLIPLLTRRCLTGKKCSRSSSNLIRRTAGAVIAGEWDTNQGVAATKIR